MPTDQQVSILVDVASSGGGAMPAEKFSDLVDLVVAGYIEGDGGVDLYKLTAKGQDVLDERGVGANESCRRPE